MSWRKKEHRHKYNRSGPFDKPWDHDDIDWVRSQIEDDYFNAECYSDLNEIRSCQLFCLLRSLGIKSAQEGLYYMGCNW